MALPRLTGALRSFSNVTKQDNYNEEVADLKVNVFRWKPLKTKSIWHFFYLYVLKMDILFCFCLEKEIEYTDIFTELYLSTSDCYQKE